jgi:uncharacterized protein involved in exopolysaccharide biosynthesis
MDNIKEQKQQDICNADRFKDDEIDLIDYFKVISKHRKMIVSLCAITVVVTAIISLLLPKAYSATTSIVPPVDILQKEAELTGGLGIGKGSMLSKAIGITSIANMYTGILESRAVIDAIIDRFDLMKVYEEEEYISNARRRLRDNTIIRVSDEGIVTITVEDKDPARAAAIANTYIDELDRQNKRLSSGAATSKRIFLGNRLKEIEGKLAKIENILSREATTQEMLFELLTREYELAKIEEAKSMPTIQILDRAIVPEKKSKPKRAQMVMLSCVTALFISIFAAFVREYCSKTNI